MNTISAGKSHPSSVALMYHALHDGEVPRGQDPHYTLAAGEFERQIHKVAAGPGGTSAARHLSGERQAGVLVTFDDGHASNYTHALPVLLRHDVTADFFVNPATVGTAGFLEWSQLREMSDAGMSIQSHGYDHVYLTSLNDRQLRETLSSAREEISQRIGRPVTLLAPPGGRMPHDLARVAGECGYTHVLCSRPGLIAVPRTDAVMLPRMAVTSAVDEGTFDRWILPHRPSIAREWLRYGSLALAKRVLGDRRYERARARARALLKGAA